MLLGQGITEKLSRVMKVCKLFGVISIYDEAPQNIGTTTAGRHGIHHVYALFDITIVQENMSLSHPENNYEWLFFE